METPLSPFTLSNQPPEPEPWFDRYRYYILGGLGIVFVVGLYLLLTPPSPQLNSANSTPTDDLSNTAPVITNTSEMTVDVAGGVTKPGVYQLAAGSIVEDAINAAGGMSPLADANLIAQTINRAALIENHSKIYIPKKGDRPTATVASSSSATKAVSALININSAPATELDLLPGVGPITAQRIIDYRLQQGSFKTTDDIKKVPGISDAKFAQLKDLITI